EDEVQRLISVIEHIQPHKVQLGTVVRPPAQENIKPVSASFLERVVKLFGNGAEIIGYPLCRQKQQASVVTDEAILNLLQRRPTTASELSRAFNIPLSEISKRLLKLERSGKLQKYKFDTKIFYKTTSLQTEFEQKK
ncbi:MAG: winged helix-turn-helix transcriptional regulator, partial [Candidatus Sumerlaeia bacterium]|nr:winged helix-turn-helix transcriptional regulator [Candidatus Sumerlaeia bacterium]